MIPLVLASASPRRRELLARLGILFEVRPSDLHEETPANFGPELAARRLARLKAESARLLDTQSAIIAADTVVALDGELLGKPRDEHQAREMLLRLRGREHLVVSAVAVMRARGRAALLRHPVTRVLMRAYSDAEIAASITRGDPFEKAGAYAIQDAAFKPVERYDGCYCNVVGLSLWAALEVLRRADIDVGHVTVSDLLPQCASCPLRPPDM